MKTNSPTRQSHRKASLVTLTPAQLKKGVTVYGQGGGGGSGKASRRGPNDKAQPRPESGH